MSAAPRWETDGRDWPNRPHSRFVEVGRMHWHVQVMGAGPVLLLLHGTGAATHSWRALAPLLAEHFTIVAPDLPGHGFTSGRPVGGLAMAAMARALGELLRALEVTPDVIVGHSAGAAIAIRMALDNVAAPDAIVGLSAALLPFPGLGAKLFPTLARLLFVIRSRRISLHGSPGPGAKSRGSCCAARARESTRRGSAITKACSQPPATARARSR